MRVWESSGGRSLADVAEDSYALTLFTWSQLVAQERRDRLVQRGERIADYSGFAIAVNEPKRLKDLVRAHEDELGLRESPEAAMKIGADLLARIAETDVIARMMAEPEDVA